MVIMFKIFQRIQVIFITILLTYYVNGSFQFSYVKNLLYVNSIQIMNKCSLYGNTHIGVIQIFLCVVLAIEFHSSYSF